jgi:hypothetical protein
MTLSEISIERASRREREQAEDRICSPRVYSEPLQTRTGFRSVGGGGPSHAGDPFSEYDEFDSVQV